MSAWLWRRCGAACVARSMRDGVAVGILTGERDALKFQNEVLRAELTRLRTAHADLLARCDSADHARGHDPVSARTPAGRISTDTVRAVLGGGE